MRDSDARRDETLEWIRYGDADDLTAAALLDLEKPPINNALFHCQQAVEKWLKAFLIWNGVAFPKVHDLHRIGRLCAEIEPGLEEIILLAADLTDFATVYRYPGTDLVIDKQEALEWRKHACQVRIAVMEKLPAEITGRE